MSETTFVPGAVNFDAFKFGPTAEALTPMAFTVDCTCGIRLATLQGFGMTFEVGPGSDLLAHCACGREYSIVKQSTAAQARVNASVNDTRADQGSVTDPVAPVKPARRDRGPNKPKVLAG